MTRAIPCQCCHCHCPDDNDRHRGALRGRSPQTEEEEPRPFRCPSHLLGMFLSSPFAHGYYDPYHWPSGKLGSPLLSPTSLLLQTATGAYLTVECFWVPRPRPPRSPLPSPQAPSVMIRTASFRWAGIALRTTLTLWRAAAAPAAFSLMRMITYAPEFEIPEPAPSPSGLRR